MKRTITVLEPSTHTTHNLLSIYRAQHDACGTSIANLYMRAFGITPERTIFGLGVSHALQLIGKLTFKPPTSS